MSTDATKLSEAVQPPVEIERGLTWDDSGESIIAIKEMAEQPA